MKEPAGGLIRCPGCGGADIRRSLPRGPLDTLFLKLGKRPLRCRGCERRFYRAIFETPAADPDQASEEPSAF